MNIWVIRHGQTDLNREKRMQGRTDLPLNGTGIAQAKEAAALVKDISFDAVYSSPLQRAVQTASIISGRPPEEIIKDERLLETDFGKYEKKPYHRMGLPMTLYWALPEVFPAPRTVETIASMVQRTSSFLKDLEQKASGRSCEGETGPADPAPENVLVSCHGGIIRALCGYLENRRNGIVWRPKPRNCEFRVYHFNGQNYTRIR